MGNMPCSCFQDSKPKNEEPVPRKKTRFADTPAPCTKETDQHNHNTTNIEDSTQLDHLNKQKENPRGPENYHSKKYLGRGGFGCVALAEDKVTHKQYAMKIIEKSKIREFNVLQCELIKSIDHHQFLTHIVETFQNKLHIYIIMEYLPMGDLYFYLKKKEITFTQTIIRSLIAQIVVGIGILHNYGLVYRELKPENLLITEDGHIKLTDYGLSKIIVQEKSLISTFVGTLQYMAPEILDGEFGQKADIWSLGVLMYELMFRENPFQNSQRRVELTAEQQFKSSIQNNLIYSKINSKIGYMSSSFRDLLLKLLEKNPQKRISLEQIRSHDFFKDTNWGQVEGRINPPPLRDIIEKHDSITFRDATNEEYIRKQYSKNRKYKANEEIKLYQFRKSQ